MNDKQHALAAEIRAEMAAQRITATEMQQRTGIKHASWRNWLVTAVRPVPYPELEAVCDVLGVNLSEMLRRAEVRAVARSPLDAGTAQLEAMLTDRTRRDVDEARRKEGGSGDPQIRRSPGEDEGPTSVAAG